MKEISFFGPKYEYNISIIFIFIIVNLILLKRDQHGSNPRTIEEQPGIDEKDTIFLVENMNTMIIFIFQFLKLCVPFCLFIFACKKK